MVKKRHGKNCSRVPEWHQSDSLLGLPKVYHFQQKKIAILLRVMLMSRLPISDQLRKNEASSVQLPTNAMNCMLLFNLDAKYNKNW